MLDPKRRLARRSAVVLSVFLLGIGIGCSKNESSSDVLPLEGRVEKIDINPDGTGSITIIYFSEKRNQEVVGTGIVTKGTEILINGAIASLADIRQGENVHGDVRIERKGDEKKMYALKILIDRTKTTGRSEG